MDRLVAFLIITQTPLLCSLANAQNDHLVGQQVMIVNWDTEARAGKEVIRRLELSRVLRVTQVNDQWLWFNNAVGGWVKRTDVVPRDDAIAHFTSLIDSRPWASHYRNRGLAWAALGEPDIALADLNEAIRLTPSESTYFNGRGNVWQLKGEVDRAMADYTEAIRLYPHAIYYFNRGNIFMEQSEYDDAISDFNEAIQRDPKYVSAYLSRGYAWGIKKDYDKCLADFNEAVHLDPTSNKPYRGLAWLLSTCPDENLKDCERALECATKACKLSDWNNDQDLENLSAAYACIGEFEKATKWLRKANEINARLNSVDHLRRREMQAAYDIHEPYIDSPWRD